MKWKQELINPHGKWLLRTYKRVGSYNRAAKLLGERKGVFASRDTVKTFLVRVMGVDPMRNPITHARDIRKKVRDESQDT